MSEWDRGIPSDEAQLVAMKRRDRRAGAKPGKQSAGYATGRAADARPEALFAAAMQHYQAAQFGEAKQICQRILERDPNDIAFLHLDGLIALQAGQYQAAMSVFARAIELTDKIPDLHCAIAEALQRLGRFEEAIDHLRQALALDPVYVEALYNGGNVFLKLKRYEDALAYYDRALAIAPEFAEAISNRGSTLFELKRYEEASAEFDRAIAIKPEFASALANRGAALLELKRPEEAIACCDRALAINPTDVIALANRGEALFELRRFVEAARNFEQLLMIDPDYAYAAGKALYCRLLNCDWTGYDRALASIAGKVAAGERAVIPFIFLNVSDSASLQMKCAQIFSRDKHPAPAQPLWRGERHDHAKIRIAYLSADYRHHPMAYSMAGLFEARDTSRFETTAISFGPDPKDEFRRRLENSFDRFLDVQAKSDWDVALLLRELEIDIAVDLMGYTNNCRPDILAFRPAPVQVNYIGFAGTMGAEYIDYIIADHHVIPDCDKSFYTEKAVYLPFSYWPTDSTRSMSPRVPTRSQAGLPEAGFVFCCFNQNCKITPPVFDIWMSLLHRVEGSVLWLVEDSADAARNLRQEAERRGIGAGRLVFAPRVRLDDYLARFPLADLFLDTLPFNAHTTASDALWSGVPVVTCAGGSFAARVAASLLNAVGLPELIAANLGDYADLALKLAKDRTRLAQIKSQLARSRHNSPLFDTARFSGYIERAYHIMWARHQSGEPPASFVVNA